MTSSDLTSSLLLKWTWSDSNSASSSELEVNSTMKWKWNRSEIDIVFDVTSKWCRKLIQREVWSGLEVNAEKRSKRVQTWDRSEIGILVKVQSTWNRCELEHEIGAKSKSIRKWHRREIKVRSMWHQSGPEVNSEANSKWRRREFEIELGKKSNWTRKWKRSELGVNHQWMWDWVALWLLLGSLEMVDPGSHAPMRPRVTKQKPDKAQRQPRQATGIQKDAPRTPKTPQTTQRASKENQKPSKRPPDDVKVGHAKNKTVFENPKMSEIEKLPKK